MKNMMKAATVALVLAMVAFGPTAAIAATNHNPYASAASGTHFGFIDVLMQILGIGSKAPVKTVAPGTGTTATPGSGGPTYSTDEAIWGGGGHCGLRGC